VNLTKRLPAAALLTAALFVAANTGQAFHHHCPGLAPFPDGPVWGPPFALWPDDCDGLEGGARGPVPVEFEPATADKLREIFTFEGDTYTAGDYRRTWRLVTKKTYSGPLGVAEGKLLDDLDDTLKKERLCVFFYDAGGRKVGFGDVFLTPGERLADNRFAVFASVNLVNTELIAVRGVITLCERAAPKAENGKKKKPLE
jgi:hypothetical protein